MSWRERRIGDQAVLINGFPFDSSKFSDNGDLPLVRIRDLTGGEFKTYIPEHESPPNALIEDDDVVIGMDGDFNVEYWTRGKAALNQRLCLLRSNGLADNRFLAYALPDHLKRINELTYSTTVKHLSSSQIRAIRFSAPDFDEQRAIADFLDRETSRIDTLIAEQEQLVEVSLERRAATIDNAFATNSLARLRHVIDVAITGPFGTQLSANDYVSDGIPVINPIHIRNSRIVPIPEESVTPEKALELTRFQFRHGDIALGRKGDVSKSALVGPPEVGFICGSDSMALRPSESILPEYLWWFMQAPRCHSQLREWSVGTTVSGLNQRAISQVRLSLPSLDSQREIVAGLNNKITKIDTLIQETAKFIELSRERRAALITAAVTGQIDVREEVA